MKKELVAIVLILLSFSTGMILTAATSGCDANSTRSAHPTAADRLQPIVQSRPTNQSF